eukprot:COSAG02_NODE_13276_length_1417_cov_1.052352_1_plen_472_part_11
MVHLDSVGLDMLDPEVQGMLEKERDKRIATRLRMSVMSFLNDAGWRVHAACCIYTLLVMSSAVGVMFKQGSNSVRAAWIASASSAALGLLVGLHNRGKIQVIADEFGLSEEEMSKQVLHVRGFSDAGERETERSLVRLFERYGTVQRVTVRRCIKDRRNHSWALVLMRDEATLEKVFRDHAEELICAPEGRPLTLTRFDLDKAAEKTGETHHLGRARSAMNMVLSESVRTSHAADIGAVVRKHRYVLVCIYVFTTCVFLLPATIMANADGIVPGTRGAENRALGGYLFLFVLWCSGWVFLWLDTSGSSDALASVRTEMLDSHGKPIRVLGSDTEDVGNRGDAGQGQAVMEILGLMARMPSGLTMQLKIATQVYEGFCYCSFSFFPAMPWRAVKMPPYIPRVENLFMFGILELDVQGPAFWSCVFFVPACFLILHLVRNHTGKKMLLVEFAFSAVTFPIMKQFVDVFSCTRAT